MLTPQVVIDHQGTGFNVSRTELVDADAREGKKEVGDLQHHPVLGRGVRCGLRKESPAVSAVCRQGGLFSDC